MKITDCNCSECSRESQIPNFIAALVLITLTLAVFGGAALLKK